MSTIARAYESEHQAREAMNGLIAEGIQEFQITLISPQKDGAAAGLRAGQALKQVRDTEAFALALEKGQTLLVAETPFGTGVAMSQVLDKHGPATLDSVSGPDDALGESAPFSFTFGLPVLMRNAPAPFSTYLEFSTKATNRSIFGRMFGDLIDSSKSLSGMVGMPKLKSNGKTTFGTFSKELSNKEMGDTSMGFSMLSNKPSMLGVTSLPDDPTPLSTMLGLPVLTKNKSD